MDGEKDGRMDNNITSLIVQIVRRKEDDLRKTSEHLGDEKEDSLDFILKIDKFLKLCSVRRFEKVFQTDHSV